MRTAITATTVLGLVLIALALGGISALAGELERAAPLRAPAPATEQVDVRSQRVDCPLKPPERPRT